MEGARPGAPLPAKEYARVAEAQAEYAALTPQQMAGKIKELEKEMYQHARDLEFEDAARVRDQIKALREMGMPT
jgi:excinuclease ABC subunit B